MENLLTIEFEPALEIATFGGQTLELDQIVIYQIIDDYMLKTITAVCASHPASIVLWEGDDYDRITSWTKDDVANRVREIYTV